MRIGSTRRPLIVWALLLGVVVLLCPQTTCQETERETSSATSATSSTTTSTTSSTTSTNTEKENRLWGSKNAPDPSAGEPASGATTTTTTTTATTTNGSSFSEGKDDPMKTEYEQPTIPFIFKASGGSSTTSPHPHSHQQQNNIHHEPPLGFQIKSRVYTDPTDKLAHFDDDSSMVFPYWECGVSGSTTVRIPLQHATVRNLLGRSQPSSYTGGEFGPYPQLVVALTPLDIVLNSGQVQTFHPGDVVLLEDVVSGGHKLKGHGNQDMTVMILTLTQHYHQVGKDKTCIQGILDKDNLWKYSPCPTGLEFSKVDMQQPTGLGNQMGRVLRKLQPRSIRRYLLTILGLSLSTVVGDFMGKVAPLWLAVVFGGGCLVAGGTVAFVAVGDKALDEYGMWQERRQLRLQGPDNDIPTEDDEPLEPDGTERQDEWKEGFPDQDSS